MELPYSQATKIVILFFISHVSMGRLPAVLFQTQSWGREGANNWKVGSGKQHTASKKQRRRKKLFSETKKSVGEKKGA